MLGLDPEPAAAEPVAPIVPGWCWLGLSRSALALGGVPDGDDEEDDEDLDDEDDDDLDEDEDEDDDDEEDDEDLDDDEDDDDLDDDEDDEDA